MAVARAGGGVSNTPSKETPVTNYPTLSYALPETHTTILPWTGWLTMAAPTQDRPAKLQIRMNTPYDMIVNGMEAAPTAGSVFPARGFYNVPSTAGGARAAVTYPETLGTDAAERPAWREYWAKIYDYYTVLGCEYKITIRNVCSDRGKDIIVGKEFDVYSSTATSTGNVAPETKLSEMMAWKNIQWNIVEAQPIYDNPNSTAIISGTWKPGMNHRNIVNDGDVKTWVATGTTLPLLTEVLCLFFYRAPLSYFDTTSSPYAANIQVDLKYIVQYKDLKVQARYPNTSITDQDIIQTLNENPDASGSALQKWA